MDILLQILNILALGFITGSIPGPILTAAFTESLRKGFWSGMKIIFMAMAIEIITISAVMVFFLFAEIPQIYFYLLSILGNGALIWLGFDMWNMREFKQNNIYSLAKILVIAIFNGPFWIFLATILIPQAFLFKNNIHEGYYLFLLLFCLSSLMAMTIWTFLFSYFKKYLVKGNFFSFTFRLFAVILFLIAIKSTAESVYYLFNFKN